MKYILSAILMIGALACTSKRDKPTNIIFLIGDGMGLSAVSTVFYFGDEPSNFNRFKHIGLIKTSSATHKVTDSAASGTAMATGTKTYNGAIGVDTLLQSVTNITDYVSGFGWSTGVVASSTITHATPASFYAHVEQRYMEADIAAQLLDSEIDFFAGGGILLFNQREDGRDLFGPAGEKGFIMDTVKLADPGSLLTNQKYGYLMAPGGMPSMLNGRGDFLPEATSLALEQLSKDEDGFFLMVEGSQIDWAAHGHDSEGVISEMLDFEKVIDVVMDFAEMDGHTLVVVTADHETGGFTLSAERDEESGYEDSRNVKPTFATGGHSATLIPVFAYGPGASSFMGIYENTELFHKMATLVGRTR
jgi:alkaline phosphatase